MSPIRLRLREAREAAGMTQLELAEAAGTRQATISDLERGEAKTLRLALLERLADALGVEPGELVERDGKRKRGRS